MNIHTNPFQILLTDKTFEHIENGFEEWWHIHVMKALQSQWRTFLPHHSYLLHQTHIESEEMCHS